MILKYLQVGLLNVIYITSMLPGTYLFETDYTYTSRPITIILCDGQQNNRLMLALNFHTFEIVKVYCEAYVFCCFISKTQETIVSTN